MKHLRIFEEFQGKNKIEAALSDKGHVLLSMNGVFVAGLSLTGYHTDRNSKFYELIKKQILDAFPASPEWKKSCNEYADTPMQTAYRPGPLPDEPTADKHDDVKEPVLIAYKERSGYGMEGPIQLWDESTMTRSASISGPGQDVIERSQGKYAGAIMFVVGIDKKSVRTITKIFSDTFGKGQASTKIWSN